MDAQLFFARQGDAVVTRHNLPHWHQDGKLQFVTFHLADSLPQSEVRKLCEEKEVWLGQHPKPWAEKIEKEYHLRFTFMVDKWIDAGYGSCALKDVTNAEIVEKALWFFEGLRTRLHDYVVMSNHVHVLVEMLGEWQVSTVLQSWKRFTAREINKRMGQSGSQWHHDSFDRLIRDEAHYANVKRYIKKNVMNGGVRWMGRREGGLAGQAH